MTKSSKLWLVSLTWVLGCASEGVAGAKDSGSGVAVKDGGGAAARPSASQPQAPPAPPPAADRVCTLLPCSDHAVLDAELSTASASPGSHHTFEIEVDGAKTRCTVTFDAANASDASCSGAGVSLLLGPKMAQKTMDLGGVVGVTQEPVPGRATWRLTLAGRPKTVRVVHKNGATTVVDKTERLTYAEERPNGAGCDPACNVARASWKIS